MMTKEEIKRFIELGINAHYFLILQLIYEKNWSTLDNYLTRVCNHKGSGDFDTLISNGFLEEDKNYKGNSLYKKYKVTKDYIDFIENKGIDLFDILVNEFPVKVLRSDGTTDYLRRDLERSRKLYYKIIKNNKEIHNKIIECLRREKAVRIKDNSMMYMKRLPKWLASEEWKVYEEMVNSETNKELSDINQTCYENQIGGELYGTELA